MINLEVGKIYKDRNDKVVKILTTGIFGYFEFIGDNYKGYKIDGKACNNCINDDLVEEVKMTPEFEDTYNEAKAYLAAMKDYNYEGALIVGDIYEFNYYPSSESGVIKKTIGRLASINPLVMSDYERNNVFHEITKNQIIRHIKLFKEKQMTTPLTPEQYRKADNRICRTEDGSSPDELIIDEYYQYKGLMGHTRIGKLISRSKEEAVFWNKENGYNVVIVTAIVTRCVKPKQKKELLIACWSDGYCTVILDKDHINLATGVKALAIVPVTIEFEEGEGL